MSELISNHIVEQARRLFGDAPCRLQVAALPWRRTGRDVEIMLVTSRDSGRWVLPKGWAEKGEAPSEAAAREAREEAGIKGDIARRSAGRYFYAKIQRHGPAIPCEVVVYPLKVLDTVSKWKERDQRQRQWFAPAEAAGLVNEPDLAELIRAFGAAAAAAA